MNGVRLKLLAYVSAVIALVGVGFVVAWFWQANSYDKVLATNEASRQADLALVAKAGATQARDALASQQAAEQRLAALDKTSTEEKGKLIDENDALRRAVADGRHRLRIAGSCRAGDQHLSQATSTASLDDAGAIELSAGTGQRILNIRAGIIADQAALKAAQAYIKDVCVSK